MQKNGFDTGAITLKKRKELVNACQEERVIVLLFAASVGYVDELTSNT